MILGSSNLLPRGLVLWLHGVASRPLLAWWWRPGICLAWFKNSARAELFAVIAVLEWQIQSEVVVYLGCDCQHIVDALRIVIRHGVAGPWSCQDLWMRIVNNWNREA